MSTAITEESTRALSRRMTTAEVVHLKGWGVGTRLIGDEGHGPTVIEITAVGEAVLLAKTVSGTGAPWRETSWTLSNRDWSEVPTASYKSTESSNS